MASPFRVSDTPNTKTKKQEILDQISRLSREMEEVRLHQFESQALKSEMIKTPTKYGQRGATSSSAMRSMEVSNTTPASMNSTRMPVKQDASALFAETFPSHHQSQSDRVNEETEYLSVQCLSLKQRVRELEEERKQCDARNIGLEAQVESVNMEVLHIACR